MSSISAVGGPPPVANTPAPKPPLRPEQDANTPAVAKAPDDAAAKAATEKAAAVKADAVATTAVRAQAVKAAGPGKVLDIQV